MKKIKKPAQDSFIEINQSALDTEWLRQPRLVNKFGRRLAEAKKDYAEAKAHLELKEADLSVAIRKAPEKYFGVNMKKVTEGIIAATIISSKQYQEALQAVIEAKYKVDQLEAVTNALEHRKYSLQDLVKLELADYYSAPRGPDGAGALRPRMKR
jgi:hypothetical protein